jgi:hypothetical protein
MTTIAQVDSTNSFEQAKRHVNEYPKNTRITNRKSKPNQCNAEITKKIPARGLAQPRIIRLAAVGRCEKRKIFLNSSEPLNGLGDIKTV